MDANGHRAVQCRCDRQPGPHRRLHGDGVDGVRAGGLGDCRHTDRPDRRRGRRVAAAGVGRRADAGDRPAARRGVHPIDIPGMRRARCRDRRRHACCSWLRWTEFRWVRPARWSSSVRSASPSRTARARGRVLWPGLAAVGIVLLTEPWQGSVDPVGVLYALGAAVCWAGYILLTQRVGDEVAGINGLAVSMPVAGVVSTIVVGPSCARADDARDPADRNRSGDPAARRAVRARS